MIDLFRHVCLQSGSPKHIPQYYFGLLEFLFDRDAVQLRFSQVLIVQLISNEQGQV